MIEWMASSCILTAAVIALRYLLRGRISLRLQYALWLLVLVRLLLPVSFGSTDLSVMSVVEKAPAVQAAESVRHVDAVWQTSNGFVQGHPIGGAANNTVTLAEPSAPAGQFHRMTGALTARKVLLPLWWCGAGATLLVFLAVWVLQKLQLLVTPELVDKTVLLKFFARNSPIDLIAKL